MNIQDELQYIYSSVEDKKSMKINNKKTRSDNSIIFNDEDVER